MNEKNVVSYYQYIREIFRIATDNWESGEGWLAVKVTNDTGVRKAKIEGSPTIRISENNGEGAD